MRKVGVRQFQQHMYSELDNIPFTVTKGGEDWFAVVKVDDDVVTTTEKTPVKKKDVTTVVTKKDESRNLLNRKRGELSIDDYI